MYAVVRAANRHRCCVVPSALCDAWFRSGALVRIFPSKLRPTTHTFSSAGGRTPTSRKSKPFTNWALSQFRTAE